MLSFRTQSRLSNLLRSIAEGEKKTEVVRQVLAEQKAFEPHTAFRRLDLSRDGYISSSELLNFLHENNVNASSREALQVFKCLDFNDDGLISYNDFIQTILPQEDNKLRTLATLRESYYLEPGESLPYEVEWGLARILEQEIKNFRNNENLKDILISSYDFNSLDAFNTIDQEILGFLDFESIDLFMRSTNNTLTDDEILALIRVIGNDDIGRVSYSQFCDFICEAQRPLKASQILSSSYSSKKLNKSNTNSYLNYSTPKSKRMEASDLDYYDYLSKSISKSLERSRRIQQINNEQSLLKYSDIKSKNFTPSKSFYNSNAKTSSSGFKNASNYKLSPMKGNEETHLVQALKEIVNVDREIEEIKKNLSLKIDFNLMDAFRCFDKKGRGYVTKIEIEIALNELGIYLNAEELYLFFKRFDKDSDGLLRYSEFCKAVLPHGTEYSTLMNNRQPRYQEELEGISAFEYETRYSFKKLLQKLILGEVEAESLRQKLNKRPLFSLHDAFSAIDQDDNGFITVEEFKYILNDYGFFVSTTDLVSLVNRFDKNQDGKISYGEFLSEMTPKSPTKLSVY